MEETGTYHLPVLEYLMDRKYFVKSENVFKIKKYMDRGIQKAKTDKKNVYKLTELSKKLRNKGADITLANKIFLLIVVE